MKRCGNKDFRACRGVGVRLTTMRVGRVRLALAGGLAGAALLVGPAAVAQFVWDLETVLDPPEASDAFGRSVAIDGATLVTGAPSDDTLLPNSGAVWAHTRDPDNGWQFQYKINSADAAAGDAFGSAVAVDGDLLVAGAPLASGGVGAAYVFVRDVDGVWTQQAKLTGLPALAAANFGTSVAISGNTVVVGAPGAAGGAAHVFTSVEGVWGQKARLVSNDIETEDRLGQSVAVFGNTVLAGASLEDAAGASAGAVYAFVGNSAGDWVQQGKLLAADTAGGDLFGGAVGLEGNVAVIGASGNDDDGNGSGSAYVFQRNSSNLWLQQAKLTASDANASALFGARVSFDGLQLAIGAPGGGRAYVFEKDGWVESANFTGGALFGSSVAIEGKNLALSTEVGLSGNVSLYRRAEPLAPPPLSVGMFDPSRGEWHLGDGQGNVSSFFYGAPEDIPLVGDWNCDGLDTVGMFRPNNGFVYLRNSNDFGDADLEFFYGIGGDVPFVGDWDDDDCDSLGIYRDGRVYLRNELSTGFADLDFFYGIASDVPFGGDFDADGSDSVGLYRPASGFVFLRNELSGGFAQLDFFFGIPGDRVIAFDWDDDGDDTVAIFRPSETRFYITNTNAQVVAEIDFRFGREDWLPVAGRFAP